MTSSMAFAISTPSSSASSFLHSASASTPSAGVRTPPRCYFPNPRNTIPQPFKCIPHLGFTHFSQWNGLKLAGISISQYSVKIDRKVKKGKGVHASLFGVGAPEVLVIGVVALLVFGPKGLAEVARNLGKTLRAFQPTIRELQEVSREFKSTLEKEIGLDDIDNPTPNRSSPNTTTKPMSQDKPETTNLEPNGSSTENGEVLPDSIQLKADLFRETLAQLQKEQEEEKERETAKAESEAESQTPSPDTPQALDTQEDSGFSVTSPSQNPDGSALQETTSVAVPTDSSPKTETQT